jgi:hypothetical protein
VKKIVSKKERISEVMNELINEYKTERRKLIYEGKKEW